MEMRRSIGGGTGGGGGGGSGPGGQGTQGPGGGGGDGGGSSDAAAPPDPPAAPGAEGQATATHPVDVVTGAMFTGPLIDFTLTGLLWLRFTRSYSTSGIARQTGMGWGWSHALEWTATRVGEHLTLVDDEGRESALAFPSEGEILVLPYGRKVSVEDAELVLDLGDGVIRVLREHAPGRYRLEALRDKSDNRIEIDWEDGEVVGITDSVGRRAERSTYASWKIWNLSVRDAEGVEHTQRLVSYELNERGQLARVVDAGGAETRYHYDDENYLLSETRADGLVWHFEYAEVQGRKRCVEGWGDIPGRDILREMGDPEAGTTAQARGVFHAKLEYGPGRHQTRVTDACGHVHRYQGNDLGLVERYVDPRGVDHVYRYDDIGKLVSLSIGGSVVRRRFDAGGTPTGMRIPDGRAVQNRFDAETQTLLTTLPDGRTTKRRFQNGNTVEYVDAFGRTFSNAYNERGRKTSLTFPSGATDTIDYDAHGNVSVYKRSDGAEYKYTFDLFGLPVRLEDPCGAAYSIKYGSRGEVVEVEMPSGQKTERAHDALGRVVEIRHGSGGVSTWTFVGDAVVEQTLPDGSTYKLGYDALQRLRWIENPAGERHSFEYDAVGRLVHETTFAGVTKEYERDTTGTVVRQRTGDGELSISRDQAGKVIRREHSDGTFESYTYDRFGFLHTATNAHSQITFERDALGKVVRETQSAGGWEFSTAYEHDALGQVVGRAYSTGWGIQTAYDDELGHVRALTVSGERALEVELEHDLRGRETSRRRKDSAAAVLTTRNAMGLPESVTVEHAGESLCRRDYRWDRTGPLAAIDDELGGSRSYELDERGRPVQVSGLSAAEGFSYSPQGTPERQGVTTRIGRAGRVVGLEDDRFEWDARGRLAARQSADPQRSWQYEYDDNDRLIKATRADGVTARYLYDALGRRLCEMSEGRSTWFGWDGDTAVEEHDTGGEQRRRVFRADGYTPIAEGRSGGAWQLLATDAASTPWAAVDDEGSLSRLELTTWGRVAAASGATTNLRFAGQRADGLTGLHYNRHRYYVPDLGVFMTPDPLGVGASPHDIGFVANATYHIDPLGLLTVILASGDPALDTEDRANYPGATFVNADDLAADSLKGETEVVVSGHGAPGAVTFGSAGMINGNDLAQRLNNAGFDGSQAGAKVAVAACNSATPGTSSESVAQDVADGTGARTYGARANDVAGAQSGSATSGQSGFAPGSVWVDNGSYVSTTSGAADQGVTTHGSSTSNYSAVGSSVFP